MCCKTECLTRQVRARTCSRAKCRVQLCFWQLQPLLLLQRPYVQLLEFTSTCECVNGLACHDSSEHALSGV
jgi:hypothetical protein